ncbi:hypothetical protein NDU88_003935 [Pleurodeles waltl]|uniref:Uncharacterized protein n=1 Tax=Pleurodeles waltl TaxID=8319 RepID=A0AAV7TQI9_PLEWA|nr:hypothetical protein NDU88_003935 [Pleurodeles waltl]
MICAPPAPAKAESPRLSSGPAGPILAQGGRKDGSDRATSALQVCRMSLLRIPAQEGLREGRWRSPGDVEVRRARSWGC